MRQFKNKLRLTVGSVPPNLILRDTTDANWRDYYSLKQNIRYFIFGIRIVVTAKRQHPNWKHCIRKNLKTEM